MGNTRSDLFETEEKDLWWWNNQKSTNGDIRRKITENDSKQNLLQFKRELAQNSEKRKELIHQKKQEIHQLRQDLEQQKKKNEDLENLLKQNDLAASLNKEIERLKAQNERLQKDQDELREENKTYGEDMEKLRQNLVELQTVDENLKKEREEYKTHITALKDVVKVLKRMLQIRENQLVELRQKIVEIEASSGIKDFNALSEDLKNEYERQLSNIRNLRRLYEERQQADRKAKNELSNQLEETKINLQKLKEANGELEERLDELEKTNSDKYDKINTLESNLGLAKAECRQLQAEMTVINQLFSQILLSFNNCQEIDLDKLIKLLEDNHDLLQNMVINEDSDEVSTALPKALLDLVTQANIGQKTPEDNEDAGNVEDTTTIEEILVERPKTPIHLNSAEEIAENLPKVWKILIELLSHQVAPINNINEEVQDPCYVQIHTPNGPRLALSISKTFIRLKDLILEKKNLEKEMNNLKCLNTHLETHLQDQEKRLELVSKELTKTWHIVGKMQKQHQQLHTQEKILRYELAQKRKLLTELKEELEFCREKWMQARQKNSSTEEQWKQLRNEFASRKITENNSTESGYSDDKECSSDDKESSDDEFIGKNTKETKEETEKSILKVIQQELQEIETNTTTDGDRPKLPPINTEISFGTTPSTSSDSFVEPTVKSLTKEEKLKRLEEQTKQLVTKVKETSNKSDAICTKLENLHKQYGEKNKNPNSNDNSKNETNQNNDS